MKFRTLYPDAKVNVNYVLTPSNDSIFWIPAAMKCSICSGHSHLAHYKAHHGAIRMTHFHSAMMGIPLCSEECHAWAMEAHQKRIQEAEERRKAMHNLMGAMPTPGSRMI